MEVDVTERRQVERAERLAAVGQLAAGVAHEFNNLLAAMMLRAEMTDVSGSPRSAELVDVVLKSARRGAETCRNLMAFARPLVAGSMAKPAMRLKNWTLEIASRGE